MTLNASAMQQLFAEANESASSFGTDLPPGQYVMKVVEFKLTKSKSSNADMIAQKYEVIEPADFKGRFKWENSLLENKTGLSILIQRLRAMGYDTANLSSVAELLEIVDHINTRLPTLLVTLKGVGSGETAKIYFNITDVVADEEVEVETTPVTNAVEVVAEAIPESPAVESDVDEEEDPEQEEVSLEVGMIVKFSWQSKKFRGEVTAIDEAKDIVKIITPKGNVYDVSSDSILDVYEAEAE